MLRLVRLITMAVIVGTALVPTVFAEPLPSAADLIQRYHVDPPTATDPSVSAVIEMRSREVPAGKPIPFVLRLESRTDHAQQVPLANMYKRVFGYRVFGPSGLVWADPEIGLAPPKTWELPLSAKASHVETAVWDQLKFLGPSDYGAEPGDAVPPGDYVMVLTVNLDTSKAKGKAQSAVSFRIAP